MKKSEVPQQKAADFDLSALGYYALNDEGWFEIVSSRGWDAINDAYGEKMAYMAGALQRARERVERGEKSPLYYQLEYRQFTPGLLAKYLGMWTFQVRRHLKPAVFAKLKPEQLKPYADFFHITVDDLKVLPTARTGAGWPYAHVPHPGDAGTRNGSPDNSAKRA